jgi:hypothetical protein
VVDTISSSLVVRWAVLFRLRRMMKRSLSQELRSKDVFYMHMCEGDGYGVDFNEGSGIARSANAMNGFRTSICHDVL